MTSPPRPETLGDAIDRELEAEGAITARLVASGRGGARSAYESARRALVARHQRGDLVAQRYDVWNPETERWERTDTVYGYDEESCSRLAALWGVAKRMSDDVVIDDFRRPPPPGHVVADTQHEAGGD